MARNSRISDMMMDPAERRVRAPDTKSDPNFTWITAPKPADPLVATVRRIIQADRWRLWDNARYLSLYHNRDFLAPFSNGGVSSPGSLNGAVQQSQTMPRQTANLIKVYGDTLAGKLVQSNSTVVSNSIGGDWTTFQLARKLDRIIEAEFSRGYLYREASKVALDAINTGTGYLYIGERDNKVRFERWYPNEIFVDPLEAVYGEASMLFRMRYMKRDNVMALFGDTPLKRDVISHAATVTSIGFSWTPFSPGMIEVFEAWALPLGSRKGRHIICCQSGVLLDEPWEKNSFPVAVFRASEMSLGWYGQGFVEQAGSTQVMLNLILNVIAEAMKLGAAPFWIVQGNADISVKHLTNRAGHIVKTNGPPPQWMTNPPIHQDVNSYVMFLQSMIRTQYGINEIESQGAMPLNRLDSNPALVQAQDMWMARHTVLLKNWSEHFFLDVAERTIDLAQTIAKREGSYPVIASKGRRSWGMDWKDFVEMDKQAYRLNIAPESALPLTPAAKHQRIVEMRDQGILSPEEALQLMNGPPDLDAITSRVAAYENNADEIVSQLMNGKIPELSELQKPELVLGKVRAAGLMAQDYGAPDEIVQGFETFAAMLTATIQQTQMAMAMPAPAPGGGQTGAAPGVANGPPAPTGSSPLIGGSALIA